MNQSLPRGDVLPVLVITSAAGFMAALDELVVTTALPSIRLDLGGAPAALQWTLNAYTLTYAVLLMLGAALGDRFGRRRLFVIGLAIFTAASAAAALSPNIGTLIGARAVEGAGAAIMLPLTLTLLTTAVPAAWSGTALGIYGAVTGLAVALGPLVGGSLAEHLSWQWIFWLNVPIGVALIPAARLRLRESYGRGDRLDIRGTVLLSAGLFALVYALADAGSEGWTGTPVIVGLIAGVALLASCVRHGRRPDAMLPMRIFKRRTFSTVVVTSMLMFLGMFGSIFLLSQLMQTVLGYSPTEAGLRMLPWTAMTLLVAPVSGMLTDRIGGRLVVFSGLVLQAVGLTWYALIIAPHMAYSAQLPAMVLSGVGIGLFFAPAANLVMSDVPPEDRGIASGANYALRNVGSAFGVAVFGAVFAAHGGYGSPQSFVDGTAPALWIGVGAVGLGALSALFIPGGRIGQVGTQPSCEERERVPA